MPRWIYGIDYASRDDYVAVVVHRLDDYDEKRPHYHKLPHLQTLRRFSDLPYISPTPDKPSVLGILQRDLFPRYPPFYIVADYTTEKSMTDILIRNYGERIVEPLVFSIPVKNMLKHDGLAILRAGYQFPDPANVKDAQLKEWLQRLIYELKQEEMLLSKSGKLTFDHPRGEKNDLAIAWEESIHGCLKFLGISSTPVGYGRRPSPRLKDRSSGTTVRFKDEHGIEHTVDLLSELQGRGRKITNVNIRGGPRLF